MKYRKKPVVIEAVQLKWDTWSEMCDFAGVGKLIDRKPEGCYIGEEGYPLPSGKGSEVMGMCIPTPEGLMVARQDDWIIKGVNGELDSCKPEIFQEMYEAVE